MRTYFLAANNTDPSLITLDFPDIQFSHSWSISEFPWKKKKTHTTDELDLELVDSLSGMLLPLKNPLHHSAAFAFLYLYLSLANESMIGRRFCVRSTLPIGAGLGSSASISVCIAACIGVLGGHISPAALDLDQEVSSRSEECAFIDKWSFMGEKCIHGNPSGIDNAVATEGGAVMFQRNEHSMPSVRTSMRNFPPMRLLLTNTNVARRTAVLVGNVSRLVTTFPKTSGSILDAIDSLTKEAYNIMVRPFFNADSKATLSELIRINHGLLVSLGVSHPSLEKIKLLTDQLDVGDTKLTGAGGGGCAITLVKDGVEESTIESLVNSFNKEGFECFETLLGGKGCGMLNLDSETDISPEEFISLSGREQIERMVGVGHSKGWKFW